MTQAQGASANGCVCGERGLLVRYDPPWHAQDNMHIRLATLDDNEAVRQVCRTAFGAEDATTVARLATEILGEMSISKCICLVSTTNEEVTGYAAFSPIRLSDGRLAGYILAPLGVMPSEQRTGKGTALVERGLELCREAGGGTAFVYGDPAYYCRFGFTVELGRMYPAPYPLSMPHAWQAVHFAKVEGERPQGKLRCVSPLSSAELW